jgi:ribonuclease HI
MSNSFNHSFITSFISENNLEIFLSKLSPTTISSIIKNISPKKHDSSTDSFNNNTSYIFTDGGCIVNKKKAAFSSVFFNESPVSFKLPEINSSILSNLSFNNGSFSSLFTQHATNNYAELYSIYFSLQIINLNKDLFKENIILYSDSMYSIKCLTTWSKNWLKNGFKTASGKDVLNKDLIISILELLKNTQHSFSFKHITGHQPKPDDSSSFQYFIWNYNNIADKNIESLLKN